MIQWNDFRHWPVIPKFLLLLGCLGPLGYLTGFKFLKGLALAWMISPLPIVFSDANGFEAFAAHFQLRLTQKDQTKVVKTITFQEVSAMLGPYNRRNVYGAVIGYAPRLPLPMVQSVLSFGFCQTDTLASEFNLNPHIEKVELLIEDGTAGRHQQFRYEVVCGR
jgi:hypothetical protein